MADVKKHVRRSCSIKVRMLAPVATRGRGGLDKGLPLVTSNCEGHREDLPTLAEKQEDQQR